MILAMFYLKMGMSLTFAEMSPASTRAYVLKLDFMTPGMYRMLICMKQRFPSMLICKLMKLDNGHKCVHWNCLPVFILMFVYWNRRKCRQLFGVFHSEIHGMHLKILHLERLDKNMHAPTCLMLCLNIAKNKIKTTKSHKNKPTLMTNNKIKIW